MIATSLTLKIVIFFTLNAPMALPFSVWPMKPPAVRFYFISLIVFLLRLNFDRLGFFSVLIMLREKLFGTLCVVEGVGSRKESEFKETLDS